jgi:hypothetical protein
MGRYRRKMSPRFGGLQDEIVAGIRSSWGLRPQAIRSRRSAAKERRPLAVVARTKSATRTKLPCEQTAALRDRLFISPGKASATLVLESTKTSHRGKVRRL